MYDWAEYTLHPIRAQNYDFFAKTTKYFAFLDMNITLAMSNYDTQITKMSVGESTFGDFNTDHGQLVSGCLGVCRLHFSIYLAGINATLEEDGVGDSLHTL